MSEEKSMEENTACHHEDGRDVLPEDFDEFVNLDHNDDEEEDTAKDSATNGGLEDLSPEELRRMGNHHFSIAEVDTALTLYSIAIDKLERSIEEKKQNSIATVDGKSKKSTATEQSALVQQLVVLLSNRSACNFKMEEYEAARTDANKAIRLSQKKSLKAAFRLARAEIALKQYESCISFLEDVLAVYQNSKEEDMDDVANNATISSKDGSVIDQKEQEAQARELNKLLLQAKKEYATMEVDKPIVSVKLSSVKPSIRDFELGVQLGSGNFSSIYVCKHKITNEQFALKVIEKKEAEKLVKRQHPNVYNEINMERRVLIERLTNPYHPLIIRMYHAFQNYTTIYYLMDLQLGGEVWGTLRYENKMVGCHPSLARFYLAELVEAMEYIHTKGIVHRDIKAENMIISATGHLVLIDFGTAKDLIQRDLNGPEFVGTPDFMPPEAVKATDEVLKKGGSDHTADLWTLGCVIYQLYTGEPPFSSQSPYLSFLKIEKGNLYRPTGIVDDDAWDLITKLVKVNPKERLGANCQPTKNEDNGETVMTPVAGDLSDVKSHLFFTRGTEVKDDVSACTFGGELKMDIGNLHKHPALRVPTLKDLTIRACADMVYADSLNLDISDPGDGSSHDVLRLLLSDRERIMHVLDKQRRLTEARVMRRFFSSRQEARLSRARPLSHDFIGHTFREEGKPKEFESDTDDPAPIIFLHLTNPLFNKERNESCSDEERAKHIAYLKDCIRSVNKIRPKYVVVSGSYIDDVSKKWLGKVSETIPVAICDGKQFYTIWSWCNEVLVLDGAALTAEGVADEKQQSNNKEQTLWLIEELEQICTSRRNVMAFVECDPRTITQKNLLKFAKNRVKCILGHADQSFSKVIKIPRTAKKESTTTTDDDDDSSSGGAASDEESKTERTIKLISGHLTKLSLEAKYGNWTAEDISPAKK